MKNILKVNLLALAIVLSTTACNNNDGTSTPKGDKVMIKSDSGSSASSSSSAPSSGTATNTGVAASQDNRIGLDSISKDSIKTKSGKKP